VVAHLRLSAGTGHCAARWVGLSQSFDGSAGRSVVLHDADGVVAGPCVAGGASVLAADGVTVAGRGVRPAHWACHVAVAVVAVLTAVGVGAVRAMSRMAPRKSSRVVGCSRGRSSALNWLPRSLSAWRRYCLKR